MKAHPNKAFTLIELLIVVAIIAILAAIAVPNFLQAQTRSRVTRCLNDMRTTGLAMAAYKVDYNLYPTDPQYLEYEHKIGSQNGWLMLTPAPANQPAIGNIPGSIKYIGAYLTTPIAYLTTVPLDYFNTKMPIQYSWVPVGSQASWYCTLWPRPGWAHGGVHSYQFFLESCGPDLMWWTVGSRDINKFHYDPTNGAISQGEIVFTDKGFLSPAISGLPPIPNV